MSTHGTRRADSRSHHALKDGCRCYCCCRGKRQTRNTPPFIASPSRNRWFGNGVGAGMILPCAFQAMPPHRRQRPVTAILFVTGMLLVPLPAAAEFKLSGLNGEWEGIGRERGSPLEPAQQVICRATIRSDASRMASEMECRGQEGLQRVSRIAIALEGDSISGSLDQTSTNAGNRAPPMRLKGSISGRRSGDDALLQVSFPGLTPSGTVIFRSLSADSYIIRASSLGIVMTEVTYRKLDKR